MRKKAFSFKPYLEATLKLLSPVIYYLIVWVTFLILRKEFHTDNEYLIILLSNLMWSFAGTMAFGQAAYSKHDLENNLMAVFCLLNFVVTTYLIFNNTTSIFTLLAR